MIIRAALVILILAGSGQVAEAADVRRATIRHFRQLDGHPGLRMPALGNSAHHQLDCDPVQRASCARTHWTALGRALSSAR